MIGKSTRRMAVALAAAVAAVAAVPQAYAQSGDTLKGRTVTVVVPSGPAGSYHAYCEVVSRHLGSHLPGQPTVIVNNRPGGGGATAASFMMNVASKDGTVISMVSPGSITDPLVHPLKFDATKFNWLGTVASRAQMIAVWHTAPVKTVEDLKTHEITLSASGRSDAGFVVPTLINAVLGTKMKVILGYGSGGEMSVAMERGEVQGRGAYYSAFSSTQPEWIRDNKIRFLIAVGPPVPELPNAANVRDYVKPGSIDARVVALIELNFVVGQGFYLPPGVPAGRVAMMRKAFADMLADPTLAAELKKRQLDFQPQDGAAVERAITTAFQAADPAVIARLRQILGTPGKKT